MEVANEEVESKILDTYIQGFKEGVIRTCEFYELMLRDINSMASKKIIGSLDTLFKKPEKPQESEKTYTHSDAWDRQSKAIEDESLYE